MNLRGHGRGLDGRTVARAAVGLPEPTRDFGSSI